MESQFHLALKMEQQLVKFNVVSFQHYVCLCYTAGSDYNSVTSQPTFDENSLEMKCVAIGIINDPDVECDDSFNVTLNTSSPVVTIAPDRDMATVTIAVDETDCRFQGTSCNDINMILCSYSCSSWL